MSKNDDRDLDNAFDELVKNPDAYFAKVKADSLRQVDREVRNPSSGRWEIRSNRKGGGSIRSKHAF